MLKKIFLPWLVISKLERERRYDSHEIEYLNCVIDQLMAERLSWRPKRDARGRFCK